MHLAHLLCCNNNPLRHQGLLEGVVEPKTMDRRVKSKSEKSLCEKSMKVVVNVIRLSSFSIAQKTLGATPTKDPSGGDYSDMDSDEEPLGPLQFPATKRSQQPQSRPNPTYLIKSVGNNGSTEPVNQKKEQCVDGLASDYISKIRNKLGRGV